MVTMNLAGIQRGDSFSANQILTSGDSLQVERVNTVTHSAEMVQSETVRYRTNIYHVGYSMSQSQPTFPLERPVTGSRMGTSPQPTMSRIPARFIVTMGTSLLMKILTGPLVDLILADAVFVGLSIVHELTLS